MTDQTFSRRSPRAGPDQAARARPWLARAVYGVLIIEIGLVIWYAVAYRQVDFRVYMWGGHNVSGDALLYAVGRQGNVDDLNLAAAGLEADSRGRIKVDENYRTSQPHIFAVGDVIGFPSLGSR